MGTEVDNIQNQNLKALEKRVTNLENKQSEIQVQFTDLMARIDMIIKVGRYGLMAVAASVGIDLMPILEGMQ